MYISFTFVVITTSSICSPQNYSKTTQLLWFSHNNFPPGEILYEVLKSMDGMEMSGVDVNEKVQNLIYFSHFSFRLEKYISLIIFLYKNMCIYMLL